MDQSKVKEILDLCFSGRGDDYSEGIKLRNDCLPSSLFRYRPLAANNNFALDEIEKSYYHLTSPSKYNDINDSEPIMFSYYKLSKENIEEITNFWHQHLGIDKKKTYQAINVWEPFDGLLELLKKEMPDLDPMFFSEIKPKFDEQKKKIKANYQKLKEWYQTKIKICCFTESNNNTAMWSHYANQYKGVCIEYHANLVKMVTSGKYTFFPVLYVNALDDKNNILFTRYSNFDAKFVNVTCGYASGRVSNEVALKDYNVLEDIMRGIPFLKTKDWSSENEWRMVYYDREEDTPTNSPLLSIKAVYMGKDINAEHKSQLMGLTKEKKILLYQMVPTPSGLEFTLVD